MSGDQGNLDGPVFLGSYKGVALTVNLLFLIISSETRGKTEVCGEVENYIRKQSEYFESHKRNGASPECVGPFLSCHIWWLSRRFIAAWYHRLGARE